MREKDRMKRMHIVSETYLYPRQTEWDITVIFHGYGFLISTTYANYPTSYIPYHGILAISIDVWLYLVALNIEANVPCDFTRHAN